MVETHFEEFLWLAGVTADAALLAWGGFFFRRDGSDWVLLNHEEFPDVAPGRAMTVGARSRPYGRAVVTVVDDAGVVAATVQTAEANHAWVEGLRPDTRYHYRITVDDAEWAAGERRDWGPVDGGGFGLAQRGQSYATTFRTHPADDVDSPLNLAVLGDFGVGVRDGSPDAERQRRIARVLERLVDDDDVRLVLTTGDNVYDGGNLDADWFASYFQPYRYSLSRVPVHPAVGNHDSGESEHSDNRDVLDGNFHLAERFGGPSGRDITEHGLNYCFGYGSQVELMCLDTSEGLDGPHPHYYEHPETQEFLRDALTVSAARPRWRIMFAHHPPYCAGPHHDNDDAMLEWVVPLLRDGGADVVLGGHEHNFQYATADGVSYFVTGAAGKLQEDPPVDFTPAHTRAWAAQAHLLHVRIDERRIEVTPLGGPDPDGAPRPLTLHSPAGEPVTPPIVVEPRARLG